MSSASDLNLLSNRVPVLLASCIVLVACAARDRNGPPLIALDASIAGDALVASRLDANTGPGRDALTGTYDPFDPSSSCGASKQSTRRIPATLFFVLDRSESMRITVPSSTQTRWRVVRQVVLNLVDSLSDDLTAGLVVFPEQGRGVCDAPRTPQVSLATLGSSRPRFHSVLAETEADGATPLLAAIRLAYGNLDAPDLDARGPRAVVVLTDGGESCEPPEGEASVLAMTDARLAQGVLTFAVGLDEQNPFLSQLAHRGGTSRTPDCNPMCDARPTGTRCVRSSECTGGGLCGPAGLCVGGATPAEVCCNYVAGSAELESEFQAALTRITDRLLGQCIFDAPRPGNGATAFDPTLVNVGVSFGGESRTVLRRTRDSTMDGWRFTDETSTAIVITGPACERIRREPSDIEIVYGCPTLLI